MTPKKETLFKYVTSRSAPSGRTALSPTQGPARSFGDQPLVLFDKTYKKESPFYVNVFMLRLCEYLRTSGQYTYRLLSCNKAESVLICAH